MTSTFLRFTVGAALALSVLACDRGVRTAVPTEAPTCGDCAEGCDCDHLVESNTEPVLRAAPSPAIDRRYSPFLINVNGEDVPFERISFKNVTHETPESVEPLYETIAESLALELRADDARAMSLEVSYSTEIQDPATHVACGGRHIYVDVWRSEDPDRWGYSLWSGCGEDDQFAWAEVPLSEELASDDADAVDSIRPLTQEIASSLRDALDTGCFRRRC